jgi:hypothetical protein
MLSILSLCGTYDADRAYIGSLSSSLSFSFYLVKQYTHKFNFVILIHILIYSFGLKDPKIYSNSCEMNLFLLHKSG